MVVEELIKNKEELESKIFELVKEFEDKNKARVSNVLINRVTNGDTLLNIKTVITL